MSPPSQSYDPPLGRGAVYPSEYAPAVLCGIARAEARATLGLGDELPFEGVDVWNAHELSWLDPRGKPVVATAELRVPATSPRIVESKSLKLYLGSLNGTRYESSAAVRAVIAKDVGDVVGSALEVGLTLGSNVAPRAGAAPPGVGIDDLDVEVEVDGVDPELLRSSAEQGADVEETLHSQLLRSMCPITGQPDWATVIVHYRCPRIDRASLLRYFVSYREHGEFHEHCVERMFVDIQERCRPRQLSVHARYTRRGGIDINPFRTSFGDGPDDTPLWRQ